jgi:hypothetical protein
MEGKENQPHNNRGDDFTWCELHHLS